MGSPRVVGPSDGQLVSLGGTDARFLIDGGDARNCFALVEHPLWPHALAAPMHRHHREDEYSFVLEGTMGALLGNAVVTANPGDLVFKPATNPHESSRSFRRPASKTTFESSAPNYEAALQAHSDSPRYARAMNSTLI